MEELARKDDIRIVDQVEEAVAKFGEDKIGKLLREILRCSSDTLDFVLGILGAVK